MNSLLLCNLSNDMALAKNSVPYFPPRHIQQMEHDLAMLADIWDDGSGCPQPWGWSRATKVVFRTRGVEEHLLPTDEELDCWRLLSSRAFAAKYISELVEGVDDGRYVGEQMCFVRSIEELELLFLDSAHHPFLIYKSPWSSSGRGVFVSNALDESTRQRLKGFIRHQGGFLVDRYYKKMLDFAMEFKVDANGDVLFLGYSVFSAGEQGNYGYNLIASQIDLKEKVERMAQCSTDDLRECHRGLLKKHLAGCYRGFVGIDMMVVEEEGLVKIHPCVEINLRMNMGILALILESKADDKDFYRRLRERLLFEPFPFDNFDCLRSCMRSSTRVPLTPSRDVGFQASIDGGKLMIICS